MLTIRTIQVRQRASEPDGLGATAQPVRYASRPTPNLQSKPVPAMLASRRLGAAHFGIGTWGHENGRHLCADVLVARTWTPPPSPHRANATRLCRD
jgi:hypothetical protein